MLKAKPFNSLSRDLMNQHVRDCLVSGYEAWIDQLSLPDPNDHHVLAAAIHSSASIIVTYNLKDFPKKSIKKYGIEAWHPDNFITYLVEKSSDTVCTAIKRLLSTLKNPPIAKELYLDILKKQSLPKTVSKLKEFVELI